MVAYFVAEIDIHDLDGYQEYRAKVPAVIAAFDGKYRARGGAFETLDGDAAPQRCVILEFPTMARLKEFWNSPEYQPLREIRERTATARIMAIDGL